MKEDKNFTVDTSALVDYAYGMLAPGLSARVRRALEEDETLRWEYNGIVQLMKDHPGRDPEDLLEEMARTSAPKKQVPVRRLEPVKKMPLWKGLAVAASLLVIASVTFFLVRQNNRQEPELMAQQIIGEPYTDYPDVRGPGRADSGSLWIEEFKQKNFAAAAQLLQRKASLTHTEQFFLGLSYLKASPPQAAKAEEALKAAAASGQEYQSDAWLYLGIAQVLQKKNKEAEESFGRSSHPQAKEFLDRLRK